MTDLDFFTKETVEGDLLADKLALGELPAEEALQYAIEIGSALSRAHNRGIVHGCLSPHTILLTSTGVRIIRPAGAPDFAAPYRAPEQIAGAPPDSRSDIFAYGAILYELAGRRRAFTGLGDDLDAAIVQRPAPALLAKSAIHAAMEGVIAGCLEKQPERRRQRVQNAVIELKLVGGSIARKGAPPKSRSGQPRNASVLTRVAAAVTESDSVPSAWPSEDFAEAVPQYARPVRPLLWAAAGLFLLVASAVGAVLYLRQKPETVYQFSVLPPQHTAIRTPAISPDGRLLAVSAQGDDGAVALWIHSMDARGWDRVAESDGASWPFWSPDSKSVGFFAGRMLKKIKVGGGTPVTICEADALPGGATWGAPDRENPEGVILFAPSQGGGLFVVSAAGGKPAPALKLDPARSERAYLWPQFVPGGRRFVFFILTGADQSTGVYSGSLAAAEHRLLFTTRTSAVYSANQSSLSRGYLLYIQEHTLLGQSFNAAKMEIEGPPVTLADDLSAVNSQAFSPLSVSNKGILVYQNIGTPTHQMVWTDATGKPVGPPSEPGEWGPPRISPDGKKAAVGKLGPAGTADLWLLEPGGKATQLTDTPYHEGAPVWSPDGSRLAYSANPDGPQASYDIYTKSAVPGSHPDLLFKSAIYKYPSCWTRDGRYLLFGAFGEGTRGDLWAFSLADRRATAILDTVFNEGFGDVSPDGKWLAFQSEQTGRSEIYVQPFEGLTGGTKRRWKVSPSGGGLPRWRGDGAELFYITKAGDIMNAAVRISGADFDVAPPRNLFQSRPLPGTWNQYDVSPDGKEFLLNLPSEWPHVPNTPVSVVTNWALKLN